MSSCGHGNHYGDVFVFGHLVYAMEGELRVVHVYRNRENALTKLHDIGYPCKCIGRWLDHSIIVTNEHIIQCCSEDKLVSIMDHYGELLRKITTADSPLRWPALCQVDVEGNILMADRYGNRLLIVQIDHTNSQWRVVKLVDSPGNVTGAVWFRYRLYATDISGNLLTFVPVD